MTNTTAHNPQAELTHLENELRRIGDERKSLNDKIRYLREQRDSLYNRDSEIVLRVKEILFVMQNEGTLEVPADQDER